MFALKVLTIVQIILSVYGYEDGAPQSACDQMVPGHDQTSPQTVASPYSISFEQPSNASLLYRVTLSKEQNAPNFKGFLIKARRQNGATADYIGEIKSYPSGTKLGQCGNKRQSVTHVSKVEKNGVTLDWAPTVSECGTSVVFQATVVQSFRVYWTNVLSTKFDIPPNCASLLPTTQAPTTTTECDKHSNKNCDSSAANTPMVTNLYIVLVGLAYLCLN